MIRVHEVRWQCMLQCTNADAPRSKMLLVLLQAPGALGLLECIAYSLEGVILHVRLRDEAAAA